MVKKMEEKKELTETTCLPTYCVVAEQIQTYTAFVQAKSEEHALEMAETLSHREWKRESCRTYLSADFVGLVKRYAT